MNIHAFKNGFKTRLLSMLLYKEAEDTTAPAPSMNVMAPYALPPNKSNIKVSPTVEQSTASGNYTVKGAGITLLDAEGLNPEEIASFNAPAASPEGMQQFSNTIKYQLSPETVPDIPESVPMPPPLAPRPNRVYAPLPPPPDAPTPGSIYDKAQGELQHNFDRLYKPGGPNYPGFDQAMVDRHRGTMAGMEDLQKRWEAHQAAGGWKAKYPAGTNFNPQISTHAIAHNNVDAWRNKRYDSMFGGRF
jgi:hypothetical protein